MHSSIGITDGIYGKLVEDDVHEAILGLGKDAPRDAGDVMDIQEIIEATIRRMMKEKE